MADCAALICFMKPDHAAFVSAEVGALARAGGGGPGGGSMPGVHSTGEDREAVKYDVFVTCYGVS